MYDLSAVKKMASKWKKLKGMKEEIDIDVLIIIKLLSNLEKTKSALGPKHHDAEKILTARTTNGLEWSILVDRFGSVSVECKQEMSQGVWKPIYHALASYRPKLKDENVEKVYVGLPEFLDKTVEKFPELRTSLELYLSDDT
jgi:hypothetical protein